MPAPAANKSSEQKTQPHAGGLTSEPTVLTEVPDSYAGLLEMQRKIGNRAVRHIIQAKLRVSMPGDRYEQEADRVANLVTNDPGLSRSDRLLPKLSGTIQRLAPADPKTLDEDNVQKMRLGLRLSAEGGLSGQQDGGLKPRRKAVGAGPVHDLHLSMHETLSSSGQPLDCDTKSFMESRFGQDFSHVRVHKDTEAAESAATVNALAYTVGGHVVFGSGRYAPATTEGRLLLAHELTHVVQQSPAQIPRAPLTARPPKLSQSESLEQEANQMGPSMANAHPENAAARGAIPGQPLSLYVGDSVSTQQSGAVIQRQAAGTATAPASSASPDTSSSLSTVSGNDLQTLEQVMSVVQAVRPSEVASGLYTTQFRGKTISLTQAQHDDLYAKTKAAIRKNLDLAKRKAENAKTGYEIQERINKEHPVVAPIVLTFAGVRDKVPLLLGEVAKAGTHADAGEKALQGNNFTMAAQSLAACEVAAIRASTLWREYHEGIISSGEKTITALEYTRDASFITLGVLAIIATGGAAAGAAGAAGTTTTAFGVEVGTVSAANLIATGAPVVATLGGAGMQAALGDKVDWAKVGIDIAVNLILSRFGGKVSHGIFKAMLGSPAVRSVGEVFVGRVVSSVLTHEASTAFTTAVDAVYRKFKGQNVTWDLFIDELIARLTDPKGVIVASVMGAVVASADVKLGGARGVQVEDKSGSKGELDVVRGGVITEEKSATGIGKINPKTGQPFNKDTEVEWAKKQIFDKTKVRLENLKVVTATRSTPEGSREVPSAAEVERVRKYAFSIEADTPALRVEVERQVQRLRTDYPDWTFSTKYGK